MNDFKNFAVNHRGVSSSTLDSYSRKMDRVLTSTRPTADYMHPYILEERQLNVTQMDVFSRLMMDRIIFLGTQVTDQSANIIQAQLLYLDSVDPDKDISLWCQYLRFHFRLSCFSYKKIGIKLQYLH